MKQTWYNWLLQGGFVSVPKLLLAYMEPLRIDYASLGRLLYILYLEGPIPKEDLVGRDAAHYLSQQGLVAFDERSGEVDLSPLMKKIERFGGGIQEEEPKEKAPTLSSIEALLQSLVQETGSFLSAREENDVRQVIMRYQWSAEWTRLVYLSYIKHRRTRQDSFIFYAAQVAAADIHDVVNLTKFEEENDFFANKVKKVLLKLGKYNNPTDAQKRLYDKWVHTWGFSHDMVLLATEETIGADNPGFPYLDRVLENWHKEGITTKEDALAQKKTRTLSSSVANAKKRTRKSDIYYAEEEHEDLTYLEE